jgi:hypothetical protein
MRRWASAHYADVSGSAGDRGRRWLRKGRLRRLLLSASSNPVEEEVAVLGPCLPFGLVAAKAYCGMIGSSPVTCSKAGACPAAICLPPPALYVAIVERPAHRTIRAEGESHRFAVRFCRVVGQVNTPVSG